MIQGKPMPDDEREKIRNLIREGMTNTSIVERTGYGKSVISLIRNEKRRKGDK